MSTTTSRNHEKFTTSEQIQHLLRRHEPGNAQGEKQNLNRYTAHRDDMVNKLVDMFRNGLIDDVVATLEALLSNQPQHHLLDQSDSTTYKIYLVDFLVRIREVHAPVLVPLDCFYFELCHMDHQDDSWVSHGDVFDVNQDFSNGLQDLYRVIHCSSRLLDLQAQTLKIDFGFEATLNCLLNKAQLLESLLSKTANEVLTSRHNRTSDNNNTTGHQFEELYSPRSCHSLGSPRSSQFAVVPIATCIGGGIMSPDNQAPVVVPSRQLWMELLVLVDMLNVELERALSKTQERLTIRQIGLNMEQVKLRKSAANLAQLNSLVQTSITKIKLVHVELEKSVDDCIESGFLVNVQEAFTLTEKEIKELEGDATAQKPFFFQRDAKSFDEKFTKQIFDTFAVNYGNIVSTYLCKKVCIIVKHAHSQVDGIVAQVSKAIHESASEICARDTPAYKAISKAFGAIKHQQSVAMRDWDSFCNQFSNLAPDHNRSVRDVYTVTAEFVAEFDLEEESEESGVESSNDDASFHSCMELDYQEDQFLSSEPGAAPDRDNSGEQGPSETVSNQKKHGTAAAADDANSGDDRNSVDSAASSQTDDEGFMKAITDVRAPGSAVTEAHVHAIKTFHRRRHRVFQFLKNTWKHYIAPPSVGGVSIGAAAEGLVTGGTMAAQSAGVLAASTTSALLAPLATTAGAIGIAAGASIGWMQTFKRRVTELEKLQLKYRKSMFIVASHMNGKFHLKLNSIGYMVSPAIIKRFLQNVVQKTEEHLVFCNETLSKVAVMMKNELDVNDEMFQDNDHFATRVESLSKECIRKAHQGPERDDMGKGEELGIEF